ncbi:13886_t:CDS:2, partial [Funneliformis geosporum]
NITIKDPTNATITTTIERTEKKRGSKCFFRMSGTIFRLLEFHSGVDRQFGSNYEK